MVYQLILVATFTIMRLPDIGCIITVSPSDTLVIYGDSTQLNCSYVEERTLAAWYKGDPGVRLTLGRTSDTPELYEVVGDEDMFEYNLRIFNATEESNDLYECTDLDLPGNSERANVFVIDDVPNCTVHPGQTVMQGDTVVFECSVDLNENAPGDLVWLQNGGEVSRYQGQHYAMETQLSSSDHNTTFDCQLQHYTLPKWKWSTISCQEKIRMNVQYLSSINMTVKPFINITEGDEVTIHCEALDGNPVPHILELLFEDSIIGHSDETVLYHTISSIEASHSGIYKCNAYTLFYDDEEEHSSITREIVVYYSPKFVSDELEFMADIGDDVSISCEVHGFPMPAIKWFDQNSDIITGEEENLNITVWLINSETLVKSTLTVTVADESYYGRYTCKATNNIPPDNEQTMEIVKPGSNADTVAVAVTCTVIVVVLIVGIVLGILFYNKRVSKKQSNNTDYANAGPDTSTYAEISAINSSHTQEQKVLSEANDLDLFPESTVEQFHPKSSKNIGGEDFNSSRMTKEAPQTDIGDYEVDLGSIGSPEPKSKSQPADTEQMQYASLQRTQPSEYQSLK